MMTSSRPYLIRAIYEWIVNNGCTPYISVDTTSPRVDVPKQYIRDNSITLDISPVAATQLLIDNEAITCKARFSGIMQNLYIPISSVLAIYAHENDNGMAFPPEEFEPNSDEVEYSEADTNIEEDTDITSPTTNRFQFKVVTGGKDKDSTSTDSNK